MDHHSGREHASLQPPPLNTVVQHRPVIVADVSSLTTKAPPVMLNLDDNNSSLNKTYIEPDWLNTADHLAPWPKDILNCTDF